MSPALFSLTNIARRSLPALIALACSSSLFGSMHARAQALFVESEIRAPLCSDRKMEEILAPARKDKDAVVIDCSPRLNRNDRITKRMVLRGQQAQGVVLDCHGGLLDGGKGSINHNKDMIVIRSVQNKQGEWSVPSNIIIRNCEIRGSARIFGMDQNGEGQTVRASSRMEGHTARARQAAPRHVWFDHVSLIGQGRIPLYVSPGTTHVTVSDSSFSGETDSTAIYLDAESAHNLFLNNRIETKTSVRELIAIDGSSHNKFINNHFSSLSHGGIFVYRNCGEGGTIRHATPSYNQFINNSFYYDKFVGFNINLEKLADMKLSFETPAIWIASRNGGKSYCNADKGFGMGSSVNDRDLAKHNVIIQNQFFKLSPERMIVINEQPNIVSDNITVSQRINRAAGCYLEDGQSGYFLHSGQQMLTAINRPRPGCNRQVYSCSNGLLQPLAGSCRP